MMDALTRRDALKSMGLGAAAWSLAGLPGCSRSSEPSSEPDQPSEEPNSKPTNQEVNDMRAMTAANLRSAYGGESMAHMRYIRWADAADEDGFPNAARLFRAISFAEQVHATNHFNVMEDVGGAFLVASMAGFGVGTTSENLAGAIEGETFEVEEMYPAFMAVAKAQKEAGSQQSMHYALSAEKVHAVMFGNAKKSVDAGKDAQLGPIQICKDCGYTVEGDAPGMCPICGSNSKRFKTFA